MMFRHVLNGPNACNILNIFKATCQCLSAPGPWRATSGPSAHALVQRCCVYYNIMQHPNCYTKDLTIFKFVGGAVASWLVCSTPERMVRVRVLGPVSRKSRKPFRARKAICEIANCLFWKADLLACFQGTKKKINCEVWRIKCSPFLSYKRNCDTRKWPVKFRDFRETAPWPGTLCCVLGQDTLLSRCLSPPRCINGYRQNAGGNPAMDWHPIQGVVEILLVASCHGNRMELVCRLYQIWSNNIQHVATYRNTVPKRMQHVVPNNVARSCVEMLATFGL